MVLFEFLSGFSYNRDVILVFLTTVVFDLLLGNAYVYKFMTDGKGDDLLTSARFASLQTWKDIARICE